MRRCVFPTRMRWKGISVTLLQAMNPNHQTGVGGVFEFVKANGSLSSNTGGKGDSSAYCRGRWSAFSALPPQLFFTTGFPVSLWFLTRDRTGVTSSRAPATGRWKRSSSTHASWAPHPSRSQRRRPGFRWRERSEDAPIVYSLRKWRGDPNASLVRLIAGWGTGVPGKLGFSKAATI